MSSTSAAATKPGPAPSAHGNSRELALAVARTAAENRGTDLLILDLRQLTSIVDYFVIATGTSRRQLHAMSDEIEKTLRTEFNERALGQEGLEESRWILLDYGDVVIHLFDEETRRYYELEELWNDAPRVPAPSQLPAPSAVPAR